MLFFKKIKENLRILPFIVLFLSGIAASAQDSPRIEKLYLSTDKDIYNIGEKIHFSGFLVSSFSLQEYRDGSKFIYVELLDSRDSLVSRVKVRKDSLGFHNTLPISSQTPQGLYRLRAYTQWMMNFDKDFMFSKNIRIFNPLKSVEAIPEKKKKKKDFDLQLFPESGSLLPDIWETIAFKAIGTDGLGKDASLKIYDSGNHLMVAANSEHLGMGTFKFNASADEKYRVEAECEGMVKEIPFPEIKTTGALVQCVFTKEQVICEVTLTEDLVPMGYDLVLNSRGAEMYRVPLKKNRNLFKFETASIPDGVSSVLILDKRSRRPIAQRVFFIDNGNTLAPEVKPDHRNLKKREKTALDIYLKDGNGQALEGRFALSVTDASIVETDTTGNNIMSYLLLSSDIKGYIENPLYYFKAPDGRQKLDLLMLTQGWTSWKDSNFYIPERMEYAFEEDQVISGEILGFWGNKAKSPKLSFVEPKSRIFELIPLGENNGFNIHTDFCDSTVYFLQAHYKSGKIGNTLTLKMEPERFAPVPSPLPRALTAGKPVEISEDYKEQSLQSMYYADDGTMYLNLEATTIVADKKEDDELLGVLNATHTMSGEELERFGGMTVFEAARTFPGVSGSDTLYIRGGQDPALFYVDDMPVDYSDVQTLQTTSVKSIEMVNGEEAQFLTADGSGGIFVVKLKDGVEMTTVEPLPSFAKIAYLGWKKPDAYYQPEYEVDSVRNDVKPDLRTTLAWEPAVRSDASGHARIWFYTADEPDNYRVRIEGIGGKGKIICSESFIGRKAQKQNR